MTDEHVSMVIYINLTHCNGKKVSPESERYEECIFGYSRIVHTDMCTFTPVFSHGNKSRAGQGAPVTGVSCIFYIINDKISI